MKYHPDRNQDSAAEQKFKDVGEAYAVLSDSVKRANYDRFGNAGASMHTQHRRQKVMLQR